MAFKFFPFVSNKNTWFPCDSCHYAKHKKFSFPLSTSIYHAHFDLLHGDLWDPFSSVSILGHKYFLALVDDFNRYTWIIFLKNKYETRTNIIKFISYIERQFKTILKCFWFDNGFEFSMDPFFQSKGIIHQRPCVETP